MPANVRAVIFARFAPTTRTARLVNAKQPSCVALPAWMWYNSLTNDQDGPPREREANRPVFLSVCLSVLLIYYYFRELDITYKLRI